MQGLSAMAGVWLFNAPIYLLAIALQENANLQLLKIALIALFAAVYFFWLWRETCSQFPQHWLVKNRLINNRLVRKLIKILPQRLIYTDTQPPLRPSWLYGIFLLAIPALNAWYLVWLLPFAVLRFELWPWVASFALLLSYATGLHLTDSGLQAYQQPNWILLIEFGLIFAALAIDIWRHRQPVRKLTSD